MMRVRTIPWKAPAGAAWREGYLPIYVPLASRCLSRSVLAILIGVTLSITFLLVLDQPANAVPSDRLEVPANVVIKESDRRAGFLFTFTPDYHRQFRQAIEEARAACRKHIGKPAVAVVSDIDETLLDNRGQFYRDRKDWSWAKFKAWQNQSRASALEPTSEFLAWARKNGFAIFLVTGRFESQRAATIVNLIKCGIAYDGLYMRSDEDKDRAAAQIKPRLRKAIEDLGFKIVVNIGDQWSDLVGGHAEECIKLPNKLYFVE